MNKQELAEILNNCEYREEISTELQKIAKNNNLVVVFGAGDDLMELRGAIDDEFDNEVYILNKKAMNIHRGFRDFEDQINFLQIYTNEKIYKIQAIWNDDIMDISWTYETDIPHSKFNVLEDDDIYCEGIVFSLDEME